MTNDTYMGDAVTREQALARTFVDLADTLVSGFDVVEFLEMLSLRCVELLDVDAAGVMLDDQRGGLGVVAASDERVHVLELMELQGREGPCLDAFRSGTSVQAGLSEAQRRWPGFAARAEPFGYRAFSALPLRLRDQTIGALNAFRGVDRPLSTMDMTTGQAFADVATIGLLHERGMRQARVLAEQLQHALSSRVMIEQAKGVLAEQAQLSIDQSFLVLREYARTHRQRLGEVAHALVNGEIRGTDLTGGH